MRRTPAAHAGAGTGDRREDHPMSLWLDQTVGRASRVLRRRALRLVTSDRGDVPGWVMVTLMSAALAVALLAIAQPALEQMLSDALAKVIP